MANNSVSIANSNVASLVKPDLDTRIADAVSSVLSSIEITALLDEVAQADAAAKLTSQRASEAALDPATRPDALAMARKAMEDADFTRRRMEKAAERLRVLRDHAVERERSEANQTEFEAARAERDQLVQDLREYPELLDKLTALILRVRDNDMRIERANILCGSQAGKARDNHKWLKSAEFIACGSPVNWIQDGSAGHSRLIFSKLIELTPKGARPLNLRT